MPETITTFTGPERYQLLVDAVTDYAIIMLDSDGFITSWNSGAERVNGYLPVEIIGQHFSRFFTSEDQALGLPARMLAEARSKGRYESEGWRLRKDGTKFWALGVVHAVNDHSGRLVGFAKITRDITERREAQIALAQAQKMDALGRLTGGVAHDFNNLLMIVTGHILIIKKLLAGNPKGLRAAEAIELVARRGKALTRQLLTFSKRQSPNPVVVNLHEGIEEIRTMLTGSIGGLSKLVTTIMPDVWPVEVDLSELELALVNLTLNARDAMREGGIITITAENVHLRREVDPRDGLEGEFVALTVADTGCGISEDILPKVFDPFFTTKQTDKGSGLGLPQVQGFAHQAGGTVTIASEVGKGTRVTIYLPRARSAAPSSAADQESTEMMHGTVLLVEDNPEVAAASEALLEQLGYRVHMVAEPRVALQAVEENKFDLVLSDIVMAGPLDGLGLARAIRERHPDLPIILATGYSNAAKEAAAEFAVLRKPYQLADLSRVVSLKCGRGRNRAIP